ncbi:MAG: acetyl-CoA C-acetyltransferase [Verrucomicrobia bacterium]|nr:MAG: acetyl-CoA C-acetyltransferase [Verrucomicrobiota bacterium]
MAPFRHTDEIDVYVVATARTPIGSFCGSLATVPLPVLGASAIRATVAKAEVAHDAIDEVIMGNVLSAGVGQNPARQASIHAGLPPSVAATTVNKVCGSGLKSVVVGMQAIQTRTARLIVAGGMESMSSAPYLLLRAREGYRMGNGELVDSMVHDGLWDVYGDKHMGVYGDRCAAKYGFTRQHQDDYAEESYLRARRAMKEGIFLEEIVPVSLTVRKHFASVSEDEEPGRFDSQKLRELRPAFSSDGTVTAGNASSLNDGAAAVLLASGAACAQMRLRPLARIVAHTTFSREPEWFTLAPIDAIKNLLELLNWTVQGVDLFEINEAFSAVALAARHELEIPHNKLNIYGGAVALGHPIGCSGTRILVTLLTAMQRTKSSRGIACVCIGGGEAIAVAIEAIQP